LAAALGFPQQNQRARNEPPGPAVAFAQRQRPKVARHEDWERVEMETIATAGRRGP